MRAHLLTSIMLAAFTTLAGPAAAQQKFQMLGPNECLNCHDHDAEREWYEKKEIPEVRRLFPEKGANAGHINALNQMEAEKSNEYAKAIGLADKYDINGKCVSCHATVFRGDANAGVSCESCHGPGSGYLKPHQTKDAYEQSVAQYGMTKLIGNILGWTQQCTNCHVMDDARLIQAGHPSGDDFDLSKKYVPVSLHFKKKYTEADVAPIARAQMEAIIRIRRGETVPVTAPAAAAPEVPAAPSAPPPPIANPESAAPPPVVPVPAAPVTPPRPRATAPAPFPARMVIDPAAPPAGSPTSIEPRFPIVLPAEVVAAAAKAAPPAVAQPGPAPVPSSPAGPRESLPIGWLSIVVGIVVAAVVIFWWRGRKAA